MDIALLIISALCPENIGFAVTEYIGKSLGPEFTFFPTPSMEEVYADSKYSTAIIFVLSQGADPTNLLFRFAEQQMDLAVKAHRWDDTANKELYKVTASVGQMSTLG